MEFITLRLDIVSAEASIFSGEAEMVFVTGVMGELGIAPGHAPLITSLNQAMFVWYCQINKKKFFMFLAVC